MKKVCSLLFLWLFMLSLTACGGTVKEKSLYTHGMELISIMEEMTQSDAYLALYTASPEIAEIISAAGQGDYSSPKAVYEITPTADLLGAGADSLGSLSAPLKSYITSRTNSILASQINAAGGAQILAASNICTAGKTFVNTGFSGSTIYLYTFARGAPAIVTFTAGENYSVSASGCFLFSDPFKAGTAEDVEQYFKEAGASVSVVNP